MTNLPRSDSELGHADSLPPSAEATAKTRNSTSASPYTFRLASTADAAAISSLVGSTWAEHFGTSVSPADLDEYLNVSLAPAQICKEISDPSYKFVLATTARNNDQESGSPEEIVGVAQLHAGPPEECLTLPNPIFLKRFYLKTSTHGTGLALTLLQSAERLARDLGYQSIWLGVWEGNARGMRFYEKVGFERKGEQYFYAGGSKRVDWVLEKAL
ncbi:hypothetical protein I317_07328 [Kwoniella heveanensis CBS 569]|nr:hypothetical protein I317_07328 [Kwoniella heveanensis CBS 569]